MSEAVIISLTPPETTRFFADAYARGEAASAMHLLHPDARERAVIAGGHEADFRGRDAIIEDARDFLAPFGRPEVLHQEVKPIGPLFRWSMRWRLRRDEETSLIEWHAFVTVEDGLITMIEGACTGRLPEAR